MAKVYKFEGYALDISEDFKSLQDFIDCIENRCKNYMNLNAFNIKEVEIDDDNWSDNIDLNQIDCTEEQMKKYFE